MYNEKGGIMGLLKKVFFYFILLFPLLSLSFFYNSYVTVGIILFLVIYFSLIFYYDRGKLNDLRYFIWYFLLVVIYFGLHHYNTFLFKSLTEIDYSVINELIQICKISSVVIIYYIIRWVNFDKESIDKIINFHVCFFCLSIILTNLFCISISSYGNHLIEANFLSWMTTDLSFEFLASKGYFMYANQISCILICLLIVVYHLVIKGRLKFYNLILVMFTLLLLGTRVANIGGILVFFILINIGLFFKEFKYVRLSLILVIIYCLILPFSPTINRNEIYHLFDSDIELVGDINFDKISYIEANYLEAMINPNFILNSYPYIDDPDFWFYIIHIDEGKRIDYRFLEISMIRRIVEVNDNKLDIFVGITNDRIQNVFNIERDFILQYYAYGLIGLVLFLGIYIGLLFKYVYNLINNFCLYNVYKLSLIVLFLGISYFSGNILSQISSFLLLLFYSSICYE